MTLLDHSIYFASFLRNLPLLKRFTLSVMQGTGIKKKVVVEKIYSCSSSTAKHALKRRDG